LRTDLAAQARIIALGPKAIERRLARRAPRKLPDAE
jgi:hypothetical protein